MLYLFWATVEKPWGPDGVSDSEVRVRNVVEAKMIKDRPTAGRFCQGRSFHLRKVRSRKSCRLKDGSEDGEVGFDVVSREAVISIDV